MLLYLCALFTEPGHAVAAVVATEAVRSWLRQVP